MARETNVHWRCAVCGFEAANEDEQIDHLKLTENDPMHTREVRAMNETMEENTDTDLDEEDKNIETEVEEPRRRKKAPARASA